MRPSTMSVMLAAKIAAEWSEVYVSPFGNSMYSMPGKTWVNTPDGCLRVSDHWNFRNKRHHAPNRFGVHCPTDRPVSEDCWVLARFDATLDQFVVLAEYPRTNPRPPKLVTLGVAVSVDPYAERPIHTAPRGHTTPINLWLHDEIGWHSGYFDVGTREWRGNHGEVLSLEGVVTWSWEKPVAREAEAA